MEDTTAKALLQEVQRLREDVQAVGSEVNRVFRQLGQNLVSTDSILVEMKNLRQDLKQRRP
jgi:hypothetical protein